MTFLPILERELRVRARSRATYWTRLGVGLVGILVAVPSLALSGPFSVPATIGKSIFTGIVAAGFILACSAFCLTLASNYHEQREGTLGLLLLTRVRLLDVQIGKLGGIGLMSLCALVAFLPVTMLPVLAGGVTGGEALRQGLVLLNTMFFSLAIGLFASAGEQPPARAARLAGLLVILTVLMTAAIWRFSGQRSLVGLISPLVALFCATDTQYKSGGAWRYWASLGLVQTLGWVLLLGAVRRLRRAVLDPSVPARKPPPRISEIPAWPASRWQTMGGKLAPVEWLVCRQPGLRPAFWAAAVLDLLMGLWLFNPFFGLVRYYGFFSAISLAVAILTGVLLAGAASRFFMDARRTGQLELLLSTPAGADGIVTDQWRALKRLLLWPVVVMLIPVLFRMLFVAFRLNQTTPGLVALIYGPVSFVFQMANLVLSIGALCWLGLLFGYRSRNQAMAIALAVGLTRGVSYLFSMFLVVLLQALPLRGSLVFSYFANLLIPLSHLAYYLWLIHMAKRRLVLEVSRAEPQTLSQAWQQTGRKWGAALQKARNWPAVG